MKGGKRCRVLEGRDKFPKCAAVSNPGGHDLGFVTARQEDKS